MSATFTWRLVDAPDPFVPAADEAVDELPDFVDELEHAPSAMTAQQQASNPTATRPAVRNGGGR